MKIRPTSDGYTIFADDHKPFTISNIVKSRIEPITQFMWIYHYGIKNGFHAFKILMHHFNNQIRAYKYYWKLGTFIANHDRLINFNKLHIVKTNLNFMNIDGKNWPEVPIYYKECYSSSNPNNKLYKTNAGYIADHKLFALKFKENKKFTNDYDIQKNNNNCRNCAKYYNTIKKEFLQILDSGHRIAVTDIPSSTKGVTTVLDHVIHDLSLNNPNIMDASDLLIRTKTKSSAHNGVGMSSRSIVQNIDTLTISKAIIQRIKESNIEAIVVLDDVTTSGASFIAVDQLFNKYKFFNCLPIINVAYAHVAYGYYINSNNLSARNNNDDNQIKGVIFDVDNTLMSLKTDTIDEQNYDHFDDYKKLAKEFIPDENIQDILLFSFINYLMFYGIKVALISELNQKKLDYVLKLEEPKIQLYAKSDVSNRAEDNSKYHNYRSFSKPSPYWIFKAIKHMGLTPNDRIIGVGDQENDIMAYKQAGIDPVLVTWFHDYYPHFGTPDYNPIPLVNYNYKGLKQFSHIFQFIHWVEKRNSNLKKHPFNSHIINFWPKNYNPEEMILLGGLYNINNIFLLGSFYNHNIR